MKNLEQSWQVLERFLEIRSPWLNLIGEKLRDHNKKNLDYWRIEKADSVVIITLQNSRFVLPKPSYRHGFGKITLDFPGGRILPELSPSTSAFHILNRELQIEESNIISLEPINQTPLLINSSFSNQKLYGFVAQINPDIEINPDLLNPTIYSTSPESITNLIEDLICLQCRSLLLEWRSLSQSIYP